MKSQADMVDLFKELELVEEINLTKDELPKLKKALKVQKLEELTKKFNEFIRSNHEVMKILLIVNSAYGITRDNLTAELSIHYVAKITEFLNREYELLKLEVNRLKTSSANLLLMETEVYGQIIYCMNEAGKIVGSYAAYKQFKLIRNISLIIHKLHVLLHNHCCVFLNGKLSEINHIKELEDEYFCFASDALENNELEQARDYFSKCKNLISLFSSKDADRRTCSLGAYYIGMANIGL